MHFIAPFIIKLLSIEQEIHFFLVYSYVPFGQIIQEVAPVILEIEPGGHSIHSVAPLILE